MAIKYVQFLSDVSIGGDYGSISAWARDKHAKSLEPEERGSWLLLHFIRDGKRTGERRRIPITNVAYISEEGDAERKPGKAAQ